MIATATTNPLLIGKGLPPFTEIKPEQVVPAMTQLLTEIDQELATLEANVTPTWSGLVEPLDRLGERISWSWGIIGHLMGVKNSPELREAFETVQPQVIQFSSKISQSQPLYKAFKALHNSEEWSNLEPAQKRIVEAAIRDAELSGVGLEGEKRERFNAIQLEIGELSTKFSNNVLDATKAFSMKLTSPEEVDGLPPSLLSFAAQIARGAGEENANAETGPWVITSTIPVMCLLCSTAPAVTCARSSTKLLSAVLLQVIWIILASLSGFWNCEKKKRNCWALIILPN